MPLILRTMVFESVARYSRVVTSAARKIEVLKKLFVDAGMLLSDFYVQTNSDYLNLLTISRFLSTLSYSSSSYDFINQIPMSLSIGCSTLCFASEMR